ncbi:MAG: hypothetical protein B7C24_10470 [Bacteroidetes bacterium 4572_77]|nr:MAG: hypothetical protein B7C24_10470 [Bacteroidetes bacterium 4572_77]
MDALTHAVEAFSCLQKNPFSDAYAQVAIQLISKDLSLSIKDGANKTARYHLALASTAAGVAFSNSMVGAVHGIGHTVGAIAHVHHGVAMAILLPHVMRYNLDELYETYAQIIPWLSPGINNNNMTTYQSAEEVIKWVERKNAELHHLCGMPMYLEDAGVKMSQLEQIAKQSLNDGAMVANPKEIDVKDALDILTSAFRKDEE